MIRPRLGLESPRAPKRPGTPKQNRQPSRWSQPRRGAHQGEDLLERLHAVDVAARAHLEGAELAETELPEVGNLVLDRRHHVARQVQFVSDPCDRMQQLGLLHLGRGRLGARKGAYVEVLAGIGLGWQFPQLPQVVEALLDALANAGADRLARAGRGAHLELGPRRPDDGVHLLDGLRAPAVAGGIRAGHAGGHQLPGVLGPNAQGEALLLDGHLPKHESVHPLQKFHAERVLLVAVRTHHPVPQRGVLLPGEGRVVLRAELDHLVLVLGSQAHDAVGKVAQPLGRQSILDLVALRVPHVRHCVRSVPRTRVGALCVNTVV
mmetsp:Transcript_95516/g.246929  ORF Transcript_95516/g.246929 Transcript_95516/m.246929 type:complete len:321 (-) Transcript_95516:2-964(-)